LGSDSATRLTFAGGNTTVAAAISGAGGIRLTASGGTLTLLATSPYSGPTDILLGGFFVRNSAALPNSFVTVSQGATLGGVGTVGRIIVVGGHLSPGNSPGILQSNNGLLLDVASIYDADIDA